MRQTAILAALCLWSSAAFAVDPTLLNLVMPNAKVLAGIEVSQGKTTPLGQFVLARPFPAIFAAVGFNPATDLNEVLLASAADPSAPGGLALASGTFNVTGILAAVPSHKNLATQTYGVYTIIVTTNPKAKVVHAVSFINSGSIAIAGDLADVEEALDRSTTHNSIDSSLAADANTLSTDNDAWIASLVGPPGTMLQALKAIQSFGGGVMLGSDVQATGSAVANSPENAKALGDVLQLLITAGSKNATENEILKNLKVSVNASTVTVTLTLTETQAEALVANVWKQASAPAAQRQQGRSSVQGQRRVR